MLYKNTPVNVKVSQTFFFFSETVIIIIHNADLIKPIHCQVGWCPIRLWVIQYLNVHSVNVQNRYYQLIWELNDHK